MSTGDNIIREHLLSGDVTARVFDVTRHYFGGYYHVILLVRADIPLKVVWFDSDETYSDAVRQFGASVRFERTLEKMAVLDAELGGVRQELLENFAANVLPYIIGPDFPRRFALGEYAKSLRSGAATRRFRDA